MAERNEGGFLKYTDYAAYTAICLHIPLHADNSIKINNN
jgi:hypothetical protein